MMKTHPVGVILSQTFASSRDAFLMLDIDDDQHFFEAVRIGIIVAGPEQLAEVSGKAPHIIMAWAMEKKEAPDAETRRNFMASLQQLMDAGDKVAKAWSECATDTQQPHISSEVPEPRGRWDSPEPIIWGHEPD